MRNEYYFFSFGKFCVFRSSRRGMCVFGSLEDARRGLREYTTLTGLLKGGGRRLGVRSIPRGMGSVMFGMGK